MLCQPHPLPHPLSIQVRSRCLDGMLVLDGQWHYDFPLGAMATFTMHPEDAIRTVTCVN